MRTLGIIIFALVAFFNQSALAVVVAPSGDTSGVTDTTNITNKCKLGDIVQLEAGNYYTTGISTCTDIVGYSNNEPYFWYEGEAAKINVIGVGGARGVITCPAGSACHFASFNIIPGQGMAGIVMDGVHGFVLDNMSVVDAAGVGSACIDARALSGNINQLLDIRGGHFIHCGGWCVDASSGAGFNDSHFVGADFANCAAGLIHIAAGYGNSFIGNKIEGGYSQSGLVLDGPYGGDDTITGNIFDHNASDMVLGTGGVWYGSISGNMSCNGQVAMFDIEGPTAINAAGNLNCGTVPTYHVGGTGSVYGGLYDPLPSYTDQNSQNIISPYVR